MPTIDANTRDYEAELEALDAQNSRGSMEIASEAKVAAATAL